jgi:hypothetical protein
MYVTPSFSPLFTLSEVFFVFVQRFILPRWIRTTQARQAVRSHQIELLRQFATSLSKFKEAQSESFSVLPRPLPSGGRELPAYNKCKSLDELRDAFDQSKKAEEKKRKGIKAEGAEEENDQRASLEEGFEVSVLRCAILQFEKENQGSKPSSEHIFTLVGEKAKWVGEYMGADTYQVSLLFMNRLLSPCHTSTRMVSGRCYLLALSSLASPSRTTLPVYGLMFHRRLPLFLLRNPHSLRSFLLFLRFLHSRRR